MINLMFRVNTIPEVFENKFKIGRHNYPKRHSKNNLAEHKIYFKATKFAISSCGPHISGIVLLIKMQRQ